MKRNTPMNALLLMLVAGGCALAGARDCRAASREAIEARLKSEAARAVPADPNSLDQKVTRWVEAVSRASYEDQDPETLARASRELRRTVSEASEAEKAALRTAGLLDRALRMADQLEAFSEAKKRILECQGGPESPAKGDASGRVAAQVLHGLAARNGVRASCAEEASSVHARNPLTVGAASVVATLAAVRKNVPGATFGEILAEAEEQALLDSEIAYVRMMHHLGRFAGCKGAFDRVGLSRAIQAKLESACHQVLVEARLDFDTGQPLSEEQRRFGANSSTQNFSETLNRRITRLNQVIDAVNSVVVPGDGDTDSALRALTPLVDLVQTGYWTLMSDPLGKLLLTDSLQKRVGPPKGREEMLQVRLENFGPKDDPEAAGPNRRKYRLKAVPRLQKVSPADLEKALAEFSQKRENRTAGVAPTSEEQRFRELLARHPSALGKVMLHHPELIPNLCQAFETLDRELAEDRRKRAVTSGVLAGAVVASALFSGGLSYLGLPLAAELMAGAGLAAGAAETVLSGNRLLDSLDREGRARTAALFGAEGMNEMQRAALESEARAVFEDSRALILGGAATAAGGALVARSIPKVLDSLAVLAAKSQVSLNAGRGARSVDDIPELTLPREILDVFRKRRGGNLARSFPDDQLEILAGLSRDTRIEFQVLERAPGSPPTLSRSADFVNRNTIDLLQHKATTTVADLERVLINHADEVTVRIERTYTPEPSRIERLRAQERLGSLSGNLKGDQLVEAFVQFKSGEVARFRGNGNQLVKLAATPDVMKVEKLSKEAPDWIRAVTEVPVGERESAVLADQAWAKRLGRDGFAEIDSTGRRVGRFKAAAPGGVPEFSAHRLPAQWRQDPGLVRFLEGRYDVLDVK